MSAERWCFWSIVAAGAAIPWLAPHPPMIDLPQHAGQLALLHDLAFGQSPWAHLVEFNPLTPYLLAFGLALPLTLLLPVAATLKLLLSLAWLAFVGSGTLLRRQFGADPRVDWLALPSFYGFAFWWGLLTFLTAAPLGLVMIWLAARHARAPSTRRGAAVAALGLVLLFSHGLVFLFAMAVSAALLALPLLRNDRMRGSPGTWWAQFWPLVPPAIAVVVYAVASRNAEATYGVAKTVPSLMGHWGIRHEVFGRSFGLDHSRWSIAGSIAFVLAPWLMGLVPAWRSPVADNPEPRSAGPRQAWAVAAVVALVLCFAPSFVFETSFVYERFALFMFPAYGWLFVRRRRIAPWYAPLGTALAALACGALLWHAGLRVWRFGVEAEDFDAVVARLQPGQRALGLVLAARSPAAANPIAYRHHALWYQAEHGGLVDFNFAWVQPQLLRYAVATRPMVAMDFSSNPARFDWARHDGDLYRYFLVRHDGNGVPPDLFKSAPCAPVQVAAEGRWTVLERAACPR